MRPVKLIQLLLSLLIMVTMLTSTAQAALKAVGPNDPVTTLPTYYLDNKNLALMPCNDQDTPYCILGPPFDALSVPQIPITTTPSDNRRQLPG